MQRDNFFPQMRSYLKFCQSYYRFRDIPNWSSMTFYWTIWCCWSYLLRYHFAFGVFLDCVLQSSIQCHLHQCQVHPFYFFMQDSPDFGLIVFHDLPPLLLLLLLLLLTLLLFLFILWKVDFFANNILSSWIWLVRAMISTYFSDIVSHCLSLTNDSYLVTMLRIKFPRSILVPLLYLSWNFLM